MYVCVMSFCQKSDERKSPKKFVVLYFVIVLNISDLIAFLKSSWRQFSFTFGVFFARNLLRRSRRENIFSYFVVVGNACTVVWTVGLWIVYWLLDYGDSILSKIFIMYVIRFGRSRFRGLLYELLHSNLVLQFTFKLHIHKLMLLIYPL